MNKQLQNLKWDHVLPYLVNKGEKSLLINCWEDGEFRTLEKYPLSRDDSVLELGACTGILAAHVNSLIDGDHLVVEANPYIIPCIEQTRDANNCDFDILNCIVNLSESVYFYLNKHIVSSNSLPPVGKDLLDIEKVTVKGVRLGDLNPNGKFNVLMCDIEGGEYDLADQFPLELSSFEKIYMEVHKNRKDRYKGGWRRHRNFLRFMKKTHKVIQVKGWSNQYYMERK